MIERQNRGQLEGNMKEKLFSKDYFLVMLSGAGFSLTTQLFVAVIALYVVEILGGTQAQAGILTTAYASTSLISRLMAGVVSDRHGRVKLLIFGALVCAVASALFGLPRAIPALIIIRIIHGFGYGMQHTCAGAVVADVVPKSRLAEGIGYYGLHVTLSQAIGPVIAIAVIGSRVQANYILLFLIAAGICVVGMVSSCFITYEKERKAASKSQENQVKSTTQPLTAASNQPPGKTLLGFDRAIIAPLVTLIIMYTGHNSAMIFMMPMANTWMGIENPGPFFLVRGLGIFLSRVILGRVVDKHGSDVVLIPGLITMIICFALVPYASSLGTLIAVGFPLGLSQGAVIPTFSSMILLRSSPTRRGRSVAAFGSAYDMGQSIGAPILGRLADVYDLRYVFWAAAITVSVALLIFLSVSSDRSYKRKYHH